ncbi:MAG TPA: hypothetical protein VH253_19175 [Phycisphaerae bacterium]|nr:hypothetical protein [Phycisphaerae bacterium]
MPGPTVEIYDVLPSFVLGFHGCDRALAERVFAGRTTLRASDNDYDWLGHGVYFWENNPQRALNYARLLKKFPIRAKQRIRQPAVVGAIIDPGRCLNLMDAQFIRLLKQSYAHLRALHQVAGKPLPRNRPVAGSRDLLLRDLDCAVIETLHSINREQGVPPFDSARGAFIEGGPAYPGAGVHDASHIQICVRNPRCIKGYFRVLKSVD